VNRPRHGTAHRRCGRSAWLAVAFAFAALGGGCQTSGPIGGTLDETARDPHVTFASKSLAKAVELKSPVVGRTEGGLLQVTQPLRAETDDALDIEYRFLWLDASGRPTGPEMTWRTDRLESYVLEMVSGNAVSREASDWMLEVRWAKP